MGQLHLGGEAIEYTEIPFELYMHQKLEGLGIDVSKDDYVMNPKFKELYFSFVTENWNSVTEAWWVEEHFVGRERLEKIYGPYAMCCVRHLKSEECKEWSLSKSLLKHLPLDISVKLDERKIYKKLIRDDDTGVSNRLKKYLGIDTDTIEDLSIKYRLLYLITFVELKYNVYITELLKKPSLENVDNSFVGVKTYNGEILSELKREIEKAIKPEYVCTTKRLLSGIAAEWENTIMEMRILADYGKQELQLDDMPFVQKAITEFYDKNIDWKGFKFDDSDGVLEGFYLLLSAHENVGRELDLIDVADEISEVNIQEPRIKDDYMVVSKIAVDKKELIVYANENREKFAALSFGKKRANSNEYRKYDSAIAHLEEFTSMLDTNTKLISVPFVSALMIIAFVQVYNSLSSKDVISNPFFRHTSKNIKSYRSEMKENTRFDPIMEKSQVAWVELVIRQYNQLRMEEKDYHCMRQVEKTIDKIMLYIFSEGSLHKIRCCNELFLIAVQTATFPSNHLILNVKEFEKSLRRKVKKYNVEILEDDRSNAEWLFFSLPQKNTQYDTMAKGLKEAIYAAERKQRIVPYDYELEVLQGYLGLPIDLYFEIMINPFTSTLCFTRAQVKSRDLMQLDNGVYI